jgi:DNA-binding Xre family transcriptional regulator
MQKKTNNISHILLEIKWKTTKFHTVGKISKSNIKIIERGKVDTLNTQLHDL